ncbi:MAG: SCP2 sterol-binding domain-containing protein [Anaerolineae bacterium]|nr:SCP2 sterol-binding domain-containing protein [Anaerolineae bacterium]
MATSAEIAQIFPTMAQNFVAAKAEGVNATIQFNLSGENGGLFWLRIADGACEAGEGPCDYPKMTLEANADDWFNVSTGKMNAMQAFMSGKIKIKGDMGLAMKLQTMFAQ